MFVLNYAIPYVHERSVKRMDCVVCMWNAFLNKFTVPVSGFEDPETGHSYAVVRLSAKGDQEVWCFPSYEFVVRVGALSVRQVRTGRPSYVNAVLIASRGVRSRVQCVRNSCWVFGENVRIPGYWNGACAGCKWRDGGASCDFFTVYEPKYMLVGMAALPRAHIEELGGLVSPVNGMCAY
ncbi:hypothetical protein BJX63DRAFT_425764 [Aspergillus granulosus]|uniref:Uncharacterized protein n=1 Tax=Aspergillus granulosus TaxID=176169 RepID=A0ABR4GWL0_9EURO